MLEVTIDGVKEKVPPCTCGKCIVRRLRKDFFTSFPYNKNLGSTYTIDYPWKTKIKDPGYYNRSMHTGFENQFKEHLPNGLISEMKSKYLPYKVDLDHLKKDPAKIYSIPFIGRSTNEVMFPNWGAITSEKKEEVKLPDINVPFRGKSNYSENYVKYPDNFYAGREPLNFAKATLKFYGNIKPDTTYRTSYRPVDFNQPHYFPTEKDVNPNLKSFAFLPPDFPPDNFDTSYRTSYVNYEDKMCKLRQYLNARGLRYLVI